jgi:hypothetical protein
MYVAVCSEDEQVGDHRMYAAIRSVDIRGGPPNVR